MAQRLDVHYIRPYVDGSAALKLESAVCQTGSAYRQRPYKQKRIRICIDPVAIISILVAVTMLVMMCVGVVQLKRTKDQVAVMEAYVERLEAEHTELTAQYQSGYNLEEIRRTALAMNMIPAEQAAHVSIQIPQEQEFETNDAVSLWQRIGLFLTGLFA